MPSANPPDSRRPRSGNRVRDTGDPRHPGAPKRSSRSSPGSVAGDSRPFWDFKNTGDFNQQARESHDSLYAMDSIFAPNSGRPPPSRPPADGSDGPDTISEPEAQASAARWTAKRVVELLRVQAMMLAFFGIAALLIALYGTQGIVPLSLGLWFFGAGLFIVSFGIVYVRSGLLERLSYVWFVLPQALAAIATVIFTAVWAPQIGGAVLLSLFTISTVAALYLPLLHATWAGAGLAVLGMGAILLAGSELRLPTATASEAIISGLYLATTLLQVAAVNLVGARRRKILSGRTSTLIHELERVDVIARRDELTGLLNRRTIRQLLAGEQARMEKTDSVVGVALLDIDHFKVINDELGHHTGDQVLKLFAKVVASKLRSTDRLARYGGEEFLVMMVGVNSELGARIVAERFRAAVQACDWAVISPGLKVTVSVGVALCRIEDEGITPTINRADLALYRAKSEGRNRVC